MRSRNPAPFVSLCTLIVTQAPGQDRTVDHRYAPAESWTVICLPGDWLTIESHAPVNPPDPNITLSGIRGFAGHAQREATPVIDRTASGLTPGRERKRIIKAAAEFLGVIPW